MEKFGDFHIVAIVESHVIGYINGIVKDKDNERVFKEQEKYLMIENL